MTQHVFYFIGIINQEEEIISIFNGREYVPNIADARLFPASLRLAALQEAGGYQARNTLDEVKLFKVAIELPDVSVPPKIDTASTAKIIQATGSSLI